MIAISDPKNKKISGAEKGTFAYRHEKAHIDFADSNLGMNIQYFFQLSEESAIVFLVLANFINLFKYFALASVFLMFFFFMFEEMWCNYKANETNET